MRYRDCKIVLFKFKFTMWKQLLKRTVKLIQIVHHIIVLPREKENMQDSPQVSGVPSGSKTLLLLFLENMKLEKLIQTIAT